MKLHRISLAFLFIFLLFYSVEIQARSAKNIRSVDFYNFTYHLESGNQIKLKNGRYEEKSGGIYWTSKLALLRYVDFNNDGNEEAVVLVRSKGSGSGHGDNEYFVFEFRSGKPRQIFHKYYEGKESIVIKICSLILSGESWNSDNHIPHCCPPFIETLVYRWRGSGLVLTKRFLKKNPMFQNAKAS